MHRATRTLAALAATALVLVACGDDDDVTTDTSTSTESTTTTTDDTTTTSTTSSTSTPPGELPGEQIEIYPYEDAELGVVGVAADDTLNVRSGPGVDFDIVTELDPLATGIIANGHNRSVGDTGFWAEITVDGQTGWSNLQYLAHLGQTQDITTDIAPTPADRPTAETMLQLGEMIAGDRGSEEPQSDIVVVDGPTVRDLGEITVDVIGLGDDALGGERLHIIGEEGAGGESFTLRTVERTLLCTRGLSDEGLCL